MYKTLMAWHLDVTQIKMKTLSGCNPISALPESQIRGCYRIPSHFYFLFRKLLSFLFSTSLHSHILWLPFCLSPLWLSTLPLSLSLLQGGGTKDYFLHRAMQSLERYFFLIVFNAYLHEQVGFLICHIKPVGEHLRGSAAPPFWLHLL